jgi:hypothetical protein
VTIHGVYHRRCSRLRRKKTARLTLNEPAADTFHIHAAKRRASMEGPFYHHQWFGTTPRWTRPKWRRCAGSGHVPAIDSIADLERVLRQVAVCPFLADEPVLYRTALQHGHFSIGGDRKRVVLIGVLSEEGHLSRLPVAVRAHLLSLASVRNREHAPRV